ncbi:MULTISPECIES: pentapeptide repeat-containing protein [Nostoc]|uniref:Pentapeptide repeat-containing protein n=1 Tax=Nostoc paludosum FACHB-159 TaxID=2692908 RepID=A0ABR8KHK6_9NOSO|nr:MULTISPECIES: pentapeptide repeat-containing protein [Nostoc]MBD2682220.1 pentapeptide repeat-containing protein [Nostoc sp. FACHB-857]MBD2738550.1 pentapeptide repeat-containing protein [Nostoc paludosum FACHB-159]
MVNKKHYVRLKEGVEAWNNWRDKNLNINLDLIGAYLIGAYLSEANLSNANLNGADLSQANLSQANLTLAYLIGANLSQANLGGANLRVADLTQANLGGANLTQADLIGANLSGANLSQANLHGANLSEADLSQADLNGANLSQANLSGLDLSGLDLSGLDLSGANLRQANLHGANLTQANLRGANLTGAILTEANLTKADLSQTDLSGANLSRLDLSEANLSGANLSRLDLSGLDLSGADISEANLSKTQALGTNFTNAKFTGACLEDWNINSATKLDNIDCQYVYLKNDNQERRPSSGEFAPGEFTKLFQKALNTIDLIFRNGVDWEAFAYSFRKIQVENADEELAIQSIENKGDGVVVIRVNVSASVDKPKIHSDFLQGYEFAHKVLEERYKAEISSKDLQIIHYGEQVQRQQENINNLFYLLNQQQTVQKAMAQNSGKVSNNNFYNPQFGGAFIDAQAVNAQEIHGNITNYTSDQKQNLAEAAAEIQKLLKQLEETNPTATEAEKVAYVNDETTPSFKRRVVGAFQAGGETAIDEFILENKYLKVAKAVIKAWLQPGS